VNNNEPVDPRVRLAIAQWPDDAPRGAVTTFCAEHEISRKTFYKIKARARDEGQAAALEPRSRRPKTSPTKVSEDRKDEAVKVRAALESSGLDQGPISIHDKMVALGMDAPSEASLARIFRERGVARAEPKKKPRAAHRRFVYPAPNACWQLDATEYVLTGGRKCVIFQLQDDHSRLAVATHVASGETSEAALAVVKKGIAARGVPQRLLTDNGVALNPSRRGWEGQLVNYVSSLGVEAITGKPYKPTTQGKNERFHQRPCSGGWTSSRWPTLTPSFRSRSTGLTRSTTQNVRTRGCPGASPRNSHGTPRLLPKLPGRNPVPSLPEPWLPLPAAQRSYAAEPAALDQEESPKQPVTTGVDAPSSFETGGIQKLSGTVSHPADNGRQTLRVYSNGVVKIGKTLFSVTKRMGGSNINAVWDRDGVVFASTEGEIIAEYFWPPAGTKYVGISQARARFRRSS